MCSSRTISRLGANIGGNVSVLCSVLAFPPPDSFSWTFNNSKQSLAVAAHKSAQNGLRSSLSHSVRSELDYGQLYCSARNTEGEGEAPCVYQIIPASPPQPPLECIVSNQGSERIFLTLSSKTSLIQTD